MRKLLLAALITVGMSASVHAQIANLCLTAKGDPCSGLIEQLAQYARQLLQLEREIVTAEQEVINTLALPGALFQDATASIRQITQIARQADLLVSNTGRFIQNLSAASYPLPVNGMQQLIVHQNAVANAIQALGMVVAAESPRLEAASATLNSLQEETLGNAGRHQTLQDQAQIQAANAQQLHSLEAIKIAATQAQHATLLADNDRRAMANQWGDLAATAYTPYPMTGQNF
jgi:hypothetical protein